MFSTNVSKKLRLIQIAMLTVLLLWPGKLSAAESRIPIAAFLNEINLALVHVVETQRKSNLPPLKRVRLKLVSTRSKSGDAGINLWIFSAKAEVSNAYVQEHLIDLVVPKPPDTSSVSAPAFAKPLADAVVAVAVSLKHANFPEVDGVKLELGRVDTSVKFVIEEAVGGTASLKILPWSPEVGAKVKSENVHEIRVTFEK